MRIVIAEDTVLLREGLAGLLEDAGHDVVARVGDAESLLAVVSEHAPELAIVDVRMPPTYEDEGMRAAVAIRTSHPGTAVLVLSQHVETRFAVELVSSDGAFGYLLKDRVLDVGEFLEAAERVANGVCRAGEPQPPHRQGGCRVGRPGAGRGAERMSVQKLVMMANQIGKFFTPQRGGDQVAAIAESAWRM